MISNRQDDQTIFIITGMHRSGTSLTAALLQNAGVNLGQELLQGVPDNIKGNFEDLQFLRFHQKVLQSQGIHGAGWTLQKKITVQEEFVSKAQFLIRERASQSIWGWKDPRTTLFLGFWRDLIPKANFVFVYRSPWEVVDSLYRRRTQGDVVAFDKNPNLAIEVWMTYNEALLSFYEQLPAQCLLLNLDSIILKPQVLLEAVKEQFGVVLHYQDLDIYDSSLLTKPSNDRQRISLIKQFFPEALDLYSKLNLKAHQLSRNNTNIDIADESPSYRDFAMKDWLDVRRLEKENKQLQLNDSEQSDMFWKLKNFWSKVSK